MKMRLQLAALILAASVAAVAQDTAPRVYRSGNEWVEESTITASTARVLRIKSDVGAVKLQGAPEEKIVCVVRKRVHEMSEQSARREFGRLKASFLESPEGLVLRGDTSNSHRGSIDFDVRVPSQISLVKVETGAGGVNASQMSGKLEAETGAGNVTLDQIGGAVVVTTGGGNIEIGKAGSDVHVETGGGGVRIGSAGGHVIATSGGGGLYIGAARSMQLETGGGSIHVEKCVGDVSASTGGGNIELQQIDGAAQVETGGGAIRVMAVKGGLRAETGAGSIIADLAAGNGFTPSRLETSVGDITVYVPSGLGLNIRASVEAARGYGIRSDFPELKITRSGDYGPREAYAEGSLNGGGPVLHVHTTTGNIEFRRKDSKSDQK